MKIDIRRKENNNHSRDIPVHVPTERIILDGNITIPHDATGLIIFAHGSGSSRHSPRNRYVANILNKYHLATLLIDLLTFQEETIDLGTRAFRFDIPMLARRLIGIASWAKKYEPTKHLNIGYFGSSTGGSAALIAAAKRPHHIGAVVSRGGRPDLACIFLPQVKTPTLLIVGEKDEEVLKLNKEALEQLNHQSKLEIIPGATHLFEEEGALEKVAQLSAQWFKKHLQAANVLSI